MRIIPNGNGKVQIGYFKTAQSTQPQQNPQPNKNLQTLGQGFGPLISLLTEVQRSLSGGDGVQALKLLPGANTMLTNLTNNVKMFSGPSNPQGQTSTRSNNQQAMGVAPNNQTTTLGTPSLSL